MSEMVERVARALEPEWFAETDQDGEVACSNYPGQTPNRRRIARLRARAAIEAMRRPTDAMVRAVDDEADDTYLARGRAISAWVGMIDEALKE